MDTQEQSQAASTPEQPVQSGLIAFAEPAGIADLQPDMALAAAELVPEVTAAVTGDPVGPLGKEGPSPLTLVPTADPSVPPMVAITEDDLRELMRLAHLDNAKADFYQKLMAARHPKTDAPMPLPPIPERVAQQTRDEMNAGRARVEEHAAQQAQRAPLPRKEKWDGTSTPVFRPADFVPDPKKGQGVLTGARNLSV